MYRRIVKAVPEGIWVVSPEGRTIFCNERMAELLGTDVEALQRLSCFDPVFPDDLEEAQQQFGLQMAGGGQPFDFRLRRVDGSTVWVTISCMPMYDDGGVCIGLLGLFTDISERKRAERDLRKSEELFRAIFSQAAVGIAQTSLTGDWHLVNDRLCQILGYTQAELRTKTFLDITHPDDRDASLGAIRQLLSGEISSWLTEKRYIRKYGTIVWGRLFVSLVRDQSNQPQYFIAVVEEVTDKIHAERALQESQQQLRLALSTGLGVWECDLRNKAVTLSPQYGKAFGHSPVSYDEWLKLIHPDDRERVRAVARANLEQARGWEAEFRVAWPDGSVHWMLSKAIVILDEDRQPERMMGVSLDISERKQAEAALRESEERFRNMADTAPVMIWITGPDKRGTFFNKSCLDFTGHTMEEKLGDGWAAALHPEDREQFLSVFSSSIDTRQEFRSVFRLRRADEKYRWLVCTGVPRFAPGGIFAGYIGSCVDISDQKLIEERLRASEVQLMDAQRLAKVGSWERHIDTAISQWSDENRRILGVSNDAPANFSTFMNCVHPKDREKVLEIELKVRTTGGPGEVHYRILRPDGEVRFVHSVLEAIRNDQGKVVRIVGASQDVTERVKAGELLCESEVRLKSAERLAHVGHWSRDAKSKQVIWSEECFRIFGQPTDYQPTYEEFLKAVLPQDRELVEQAERHRLAEKNGTSIEYRIVRPDGDVRTVKSVAEVVLDEEGGPVRMFGAVQDITDVRRAQEESVARQKLESLGVLAGGIAHDFNNLLGGILAEAELVEADLPADSSPVEEIQRIKAVAMHGAEIVRELMIYAGQDQTSLVEPVDLSRLVEEMLELLKVSISKQVILKIDLGKNMPAVLGSAPQIRQVLMNLVINASEAIGEQVGVIHVATSRVTRGSGLVGDNAVSPTGNYVRLEVSDTGCGITEEVKVRIFDPFFSTKFPGRGLGLAVVQGIVRSHDGAIDLVSIPGQGTTFQVMLPSTSKRAADTPNAISSPGMEQSNAGAGTILVVEDEELLRLAVSKALRKKGFSVIEASDGSAATDLLRTHLNDLDVILLDVTVPGRSSREIFEEVQRIRPNLKVILTSAYGKETVDATFTGMRVEHFIRKPFQLGDLVSLLRGAPST
jgi:PAS domain S-box-containing protein